MTNVRTNNQDAKAELDRFYLEDARNGRTISLSSRQIEQDELMVARSELAELRGEVAELRARLATIRGETDGLNSRPAIDEHSWLRIGVTMMATFVLGKLVQRLHLGAPGAAAVPMIAAQIDRRLW